MNLDWLQTFYIVGAIVLLAISILVYPTLRERSRRRASKR